MFGVGVALIDGCVFQDPDTSRCYVIKDRTVSERNTTYSLHLEF